MRSSATFFRYAFGSILAVLFVITLLVSLVLFNGSSLLLNPAVYKKALNKTGFYERLPALAAVQIVQSMNESTGGGGGTPEYFRYLDKEDFESVIEALLPPGWLQGQAESIIEQYFSYLTQETDAVILDMVPLKEHITSEQGLNIILALTNAQPPCTDEQIDAYLGLTSSLQSSGGAPTLTICKIPWEEMEEIFPILKENLNMAVAQIPDQAVVLETSSEGATEESTRNLALIRVFLMLSPLIPIILLLFMSAFVVRSAVSWLRWWGIPLLTTAVLGIGVTLAGIPLSDWAITDKLLPQIPSGISIELVRMGLDVLNYVIGSFLTRTGITFGLVFLAGLGLVIGSILAARRVQPLESVTLPYYPQQQ
jgi:hypothetical protein